MTEAERLSAALADRYRIERELGAGGMATVYLAHDLRHDRKVAVKVLRPDLAAAVGAERFLKEIHTTANLHHPHILPLYDSGDADGLLYYVMPFIDGPPLRQRLLEEGELPIPDVLRILRDVLDALTEAHAQGVVHRDIKPENVLLRGRHALVADFGVAKAVSDATGRQALTTAGVALGTPAYMAPEQASADPHLDHRVDIYAVGILAYELLTGRTPFQGARSQSILAAHLQEEPKPVSKYRESVAPELEATVMRCLAKLPADRWQSAEELLQQVERLSTPSGGSTPAGTMPLLRSAGRPRRTGLLVGAGALGVAGIAALLAFWWTRGTEPSAVRLVVPVQLTANPLESSVTGAAISPDGKYLAFTDPRGLVLQSLATSEIHVVDIGVGVVPWRVKWFPDSDRLLFLGADSAKVTGLWSVGLFGGRAQLVADRVFDAAVAPDGKQVAMIRRLGTDQRSFRELWVAGPSGEDARRIVQADSAESFWTLTWEPESRAVGLGVWASTGMRIDLASVDDGSRRVLMRDPLLFQNWTGPLPFAWCADGHLLYSRRDGPGHQATSNVWIVGTDLRAGAVSGKPRRVTQWQGANVRELSVTPDCSRAVVLQVRNQSDVFVGELDASRRAFRGVRQLTLDERDDYPRAWSPDGSRLLIASARSGVYQLYAASPTGQADALEAVQRAPGDQNWAAAYAPTGDLLLVLQADGVWAVPVAAGGARRLLEGSFGAIACVPGPPGTCVLGRTSGRDYVFATLDPAGGAVHDVARMARRIPFTNWNLAPDGRHVAVVHGDDNTVTIVDLHSQAEQVVVVEGRNNFEFVGWNARGDGFYVNAGTVRADAYPALVSVETDGRAHLLRREPSAWHVYPMASPDGRYVAFASMSFHGNAWMIAGFR